MADIIVVLIVIVLLGFALRGAIRHFKGDSPCCGGGTGIIKTDDKELKNPVIGKKIVHIEGMTCEHCVQSVKKALNEIEGVSVQSLLLPYPPVILLSYLLCNRSNLKSCFFNCFFQNIIFNLTVIRHHCFFLL